MSRKERFALIAACLTVSLVGGLVGGTLLQSEAVATSAQDEFVGREFGADLYVTKPLDVDALLLDVRHLLDRPAGGQVLGRSVRGSA